MVDHLMKIRIIKAPVTLERTIIELRHSPDFAEIRPIFCYIYDF